MKGRMASPVHDFKKALRFYCWSETVLISFVGVLADPNLDAKLDLLEPAYAAMNYSNSNYCLFLPNS